MNAYPFSIFKRADRSCYSVSFKDSNGKYLRPVSTGKKTEDEALQAAFTMLREGIPQKDKVKTVKDLVLKDEARKLKTEDEADVILAELKRLGLVKSYILNKAPDSEPFIDFMTRFWDWENSEYIKEKLRKSHGIHKRHCKQQGNAITQHWKPFFEGRLLGEITAKDINNFINEMAMKELSSGRKNVIIKAGFKPLRWAFSKNDIEIDPTRGQMLFSLEEGKRAILPPKIAAALFRLEWSNERAKLANMLASVTGMRSGEILALRYKDLGPDCLFVQGAWNYVDLLKLPKNNETRTVEISFPILIQMLVEQVKKNPWGVSPDSFVFWSDFHADKPMQGYFLLNGLREALQKIGFSEGEAKEYDFHGWRHFFTSYMVKKLDRKQLKQQTGHKTDDMIDRYSDHETEGEREFIQAKQRETFAGLLPEQVMLLEYKDGAKTAAA